MTNDTQRSFVHPMTFINVLVEYNLVIKELRLRMREYLI